MQHYRFQYHRLRAVDVYPPHQSRPLHHAHVDSASQSNNQHHRHRAVVHQRLWSGRS